MSNTKICPACQKELPILSVRCKYCGMKQTFDHDGESIGAAPTTKPIKAVSKKSTAKSSVAPGEKLATTLQPRPVADIQKHPAKKKATVGFGRTGDVKPIPHRSSEKATSGKKKTVMGVGAPKITGASTKSGGSKSEPPRSTSLSIKPPKPTSMSATAGVKSSTRKSRTSIEDIQKPKTVGTSIAADDSSLKNLDMTDASWIPELEEPSQLITLDSVDGEFTGANSNEITSEVEIDEMMEVPRGVVANDSDTVVNSASAGHSLSTTENISTEKKTRRMKPAVALVAIVGVLTVVGLSMAIVLSNDEKAEVKPAEKVAVKSVMKSSVGETEKRPEPPAKAAKAKAVKGEAAKSEAEKAEKIKETPVEETAAIAEEREPEPPPQLSNRDCQPLTSYASFLWDQVLKDAVAHVRGVSVCDILGKNVETIKTAFAADAVYFNEGYDGLKNGSALEVYVTDERGADAPRVSFLFYQDKLFRIVFEYGLLRDVSFNMKKFGKLWRGEAKVYRLPEQTIVAIDDGEVRLELVTDKIGSPNRRAVISDLKVGHTLAKKLDMLWRATQKAAKAEAYHSKGKLNRAVRMYLDAIREDPHYSTAYVGLSEALLELKNLKRAQTALDKGLKIARDKRIVAQFEKLRVELKKLREKKEA